MSNQTITPLVGALVMTTFLAGNQTIVPNAGTAVMTTYTSSSSSIAPATASLSYAGNLPTQTYQELPPATSALAFSGLAPLVSVSQTITPVAGSLVFTGQSSGVPVIETPITVALALAGAPPALGYGINPASAGSLSFSSAAPVIAQTWSATPGTGSLGLSGNPPGGNITITVSAGGLLLAGVAPALLVAYSIAPPTGSCALTGVAPSLGTPVTIAPAAAALIASGQPAQVGSNGVLTPASGAIAFTGVQATKSQAFTITPSVGGALFGGSAPLLPVSLTPPSGGAVFAGLAPAGLALQITPSTGGLALAGLAPSSINGRATVAGQLVAQGYAPQIAQTFNGTITPMTGSVQFILVLCDPEQTGEPGTFADIVIVETYPNVQPYVSRPEPFGAFYQRVGEVLTYGIDWTGWLANRWEAGTNASVGSIIQPSIATGYQYSCFFAGQTGASEPTWPAYPGEITLDGSAQWAAEAIDTSSLQATVANSTWSAPAGIVLSGNFLIGQMSVITIDTSQAVSGTQYDVLCTVNFSDGQRKVGKIRIKAQ